MNVFLILLVLISCLPSFAEWNQSHFQNGCTVYNLSGEVKAFPGRMCLFLDDGSFVSVGERSIKRISPDKTVMWETSGIFHHQINLSSNKNRILAMMTENTKRGTRIERDDILVIIDIKEGKILHRKNARDIVITGKFKPLQWNDTPIVPAVKADIETTHFNSIYEIPVNKGEKKASYLKAGNIIINSVGIGIFILSPDLEQILFQKTYPHSVRNDMHDVQVTPDGTFLIFNNVVQDSQTTYKYSAIQKYDPVSEKMTLNYPKEDARAFFFSIACGGVQQIDDDHIFFSHVVNGGYIYSLQKKKIIQTVPGTNGELFLHAPAQQIKIVDIRKFLENQKK